MTDYLHSRTALLPRVKLREPHRAIGRNTAEAMRVGAVYGYRGLVSEILRQLLKEIPSKYQTNLIATGGDAKLIAGSTGFSPWLRLPLLWRDFASLDVEISPLEASFRPLQRPTKQPPLELPVSETFRPERVAKAKQLQSSVIGLNYRRATLDPIPSIVVGDTMISRTAAV